MEKVFLKYLFCVCLDIRIYKPDLNNLNIYTLTSLISMLLILFFLKKVAPTPGLFEPPHLIERSAYKIWKKDGRLFITHSFTNCTWRPLLLTWS